MLKKRTHPYFISNLQSPTRGLVTVVTHLQYNRMSSLERLLAAWSGPAHVTLYVTDSEAHAFANYMNVSTVLRKPLVAYHIVYKRDVSTLISFTVYT